MHERWTCDRHHLFEQNVITVWRVDYVKPGICRKTYKWRCKRDCLREYVFYWNATRTHVMLRDIIARMKYSTPDLCINNDIIIIIIINTILTTEDLSICLRIPHRFRVNSLSHHYPRRFHSHAVKIHSYVFLLRKTTNTVNRWETVFQYILDQHVVYPKL